MSENRKKMSKTEYLYGADNVLKIAEVPEDLINQRLEILEENLEKLLSVHYSLRDSYRINAVIKAIKFWKTINEH